MFRRIMTAATAAVLSVLMAVPAFAATGQTNLTLFVENDPVYTVTVPETVALSATEVTDITVKADTAYIKDTQKVSVTFGKGIGTQSGRLYMTGDVAYENGRYPMMTLMIAGTKEITAANGDASKIIYKMGALEKQIKGMELVSFTGNAEGQTAAFKIYPCSLDYPEATGAENNLVLHKGVHYAVAMEYNIGLVTK